MIIDKNLPNGFSPNRTKNLLEQREVRESDRKYAKWLSQNSENARVLTYLQSAGTVQLGNIGPRSYHEKLQANIEAFCEKSGRDSP